MEKDKHLAQDEENTEKKQDNDEDLLYTHKPESRDSSLRWNSAFCKKPGR